LILKLNISPKTPRTKLSNDMFAERKCCEVFVYKSETFHCRRPNSISHCDIGEQNPQNLPFSLHDVDPSNTAMPRPTSHTTTNRRSNVEALSHNGYNGTPQMWPRKYPFQWTDRQYLPHPWTRPNYDAKRHPDPIRRFSTMHWTDRPTERPRESLTTIGRCAPRATWPNNNNDDKV